MCNDSRYSARYICVYISVPVEVKMSGNSNSDGVSSSGSATTGTGTGNLTTAAATTTSTTLQEDTPRDVRLLHLLLASQAIHQYEDQVPLQLMDFAYRYTRGVLKDAMIYNEYMEANMVHDISKSTSTSTSNTNANANATSSSATTQTETQAQTQTSNQDSNKDQTTTTTATTSTSDQKSQSSSSSSSSLTIEDIRLAIAARTQYQFKPTAPRELLLQLAAERNKKALPQVLGSWGIRLPPEKYCLTAKEWDLNEDRTAE